ncbi:hypothetical protein E4U42_004661 [Claviceps africana]|uniref:F-box domain-containing protein n=1 Tax=Claviceps africana TaxID=83212 RepID=A0A8K0NKM4_9HYPO|nr:hypothetical protein E4U42_004661 [Claviceps africana]
MDFDTSDSSFDYGYGSLPYTSPYDLSSPYNFLSPISYVFQSLYNDSTSRSGSSYAPRPPTPTSSTPRSDIPRSYARRSNVRSVPVPIDPAARVNNKNPYLLRRLSYFDHWSHEMVYGVHRIPHHGMNRPRLPMMSEISAWEKTRLTVAETSSPLAASAQKLSRSLALAAKRRSTRWRLSFIEHIRKAVAIMKMRGSARDAPAKCALRLLNLPNETLLDIMSYLDEGGLYSLRQTSSLFRTLFDAPQFNFCHQESTLVGRHMAFDIKTIHPGNERLIRHWVNRDKYCSSCLAIEESGILQKKVEALEELRYCDGCGEQHLDALFLPKDSKEYEEGSGQQTCIGRLGHVKLCDQHSTSIITWQDIERRATKPWNDPPYMSACTDRSHGPPSISHVVEFDQLSGCSFPRLIVCPRQDPQDRPNRPNNRNIPPIHLMGYGWDLPLLELHFSTSRVSLTDLKRKLSSLVVDAFQSGQGRRLCQHISADKEILQFIQSGICSCFLKGGYLELERFTGGYWDRCRCRQQTTLECRVCGAVYMWRSGRGMVILCMRYLWSIQKPTSLGWLSLLDKDAIFTNHNKHVLWCDTPHCRTNKSGRWEFIIKRNARRAAYLSRGQSWDETADQGQWHDPESDWYNVLDVHFITDWDCREVWKASQLGSLCRW